MKSQIIDDKHSILCFCEQHHAHFTCNSEPTFQHENFLIYCHLKIVIFAKSGKFSDFLVILASHNPSINLQNTHIFDFAGTTPSLLYNDFRKNLTLRVICSVMALIQNLKFFIFLPQLTSIDIKIAITLQGKKIWPSNFQNFLISMS